METVSWETIASKEFDLSQYGSELETKLGWGSVETIGIWEVIIGEEFDVLQYGSELGIETGLGSAKL